MQDDLAEFRRLSFSESRIPALDALEGFVPTGAERDPAVESARSLTGFSRWCPVAGGHRLQFLYESGEYDRQRFTLVKGAWNHEHCTRCSARIDFRTRCFTARSGPFIVLCEGCHELVAHRRTGTA